MSDKSSGVAAAVLDDESMHILQQTVQTRRKAREQAWIELETAFKKERLTDGDSDTRVVWEWIQAFRATATCRLLLRDAHELYLWKGVDGTYLTMTDTSCFKRYLVTGFLGRFDNRTQVVNVDRLGNCFTPLELASIRASFAPHGAVYAMLAEQA